MISPRFIDDAATRKALTRRPRVRFCEVRASPQARAAGSSTVTRCEIKNAEAYAVHARVYGRFIAMRHAVLQNLVRVGDNVSAFASAHGAKAQLRAVLAQLEDRNAFPHVDQWLPATFDAVLVLPQIVVQQVRQGDVATSESFAKACAPMG